MKHSLNIALLGRDFGWGGGIELLRMVANALLSFQDGRELRLYLLLPVENKINTLADLRRIIGKTTQSLINQRQFILPRLKPAFDPNFPDYFKNIEGNVEIIEYNLETGLTPALQQINADVVIPAGTSLGASFPIPWVGYIYDFQHKYLPNYFSATECLNRDIHFATMLRDAKAVIVNAKSVRDDIDKFYPYHQCKVFNLPFSASPISSWLVDDKTDILTKYKLPPQYFLISNQFWIHKSHSTAFQALKILVDESYGDNLRIVCTGKMDDYRFPDFFQGLKKEVDGLGLTDRIHFLGHIPKSDQIAIMKKSLAVIQPTLFEGGPGGGAVYDAVALGVPAILSDIATSKEIMIEENLFYFNAGSATDLAAKIKFFLQQQARRPSMEKLIMQGNLRKRRLGECLLEATSYVRSAVRHCN